MEITAARLRAQRLVGPGFESVVDAVRTLGAVQAQDFEGAKWALAMRSRATEAEIDAAYASGAIVRTHVLRPTWHFAAADDIAWLLELTGPRVRAGLRSRHRVLDVDAETISRAESVFGAVLAGGRALTRRQLGDELRDAGIQNDGQRLGHLVLCAELDGLLVSGPPAGRQHTYMLLGDRVAAGRRLSGEDALRELAVRYFTSHGPARLEDFVWWSGLRVADARRAIELAGAALTCLVHDGREHWVAAAAEPGSSAGVVRLLPSWDEYTVAYRDRSAIEPPIAYDPSFFRFQSILSNAVVVDGRVCGTWSWTRGAADVVEARLLTSVTPDVARRLGEQVERLAAFRERSVELRVAT